jgi:hypothetical protein
MSLDSKYLVSNFHEDTQSTLGGTLGGKHRQSVGNIEITTEEIGDRIITTISTKNLATVSSPKCESHPTIVVKQSYSPNTTQATAKHRTPSQSVHYLPN